MTSPARPAFRTLFALDDLPAPLEELLCALGGKVESRAEDYVTVSFADGGRANFSHAVRGVGGDPFARSILGTVTRLRRRGPTEDAESRRDRILRRFQDARARVGAMAPEGFSADTLAAIAALAERTRAFLFDGDTLRSSVGELLVDRHGYVAERIPDNWQLKPFRLRTP